MKRRFFLVLYKVAFCFMAVVLTACQRQPKPAKTGQAPESPVQVVAIEQSKEEGQRPVIEVSDRPGEDEWQALSVDKDWAAAYDLVEEMPCFPGGYDSLQHYLFTHVHYPIWAVEKGIEGRVIVRFVVMPDGSISSVYVDDSVVEADSCLAKEAVRLVSSMPRWVPGRHQGKEVAVRCVLPISFKLP